MSFFRPATFPLLKLPFLCIKCVIHNSDLFDIIYFASLSNRTRRIVRHSKYPLKEIDVLPNSSRKISMGNRRTWHFKHDKYRYGVPLVLRRNSEPLRACRGFNPDGGHYLESCTAGDELEALKMGLEFMIEVFGCSIRNIFVDGSKLSELTGLRITSARQLFICGHEPVNLTDLKSVLENIEVTDRYVFNARIPKDFCCDPKIFKCRLLHFSSVHSADWVTLELLCQFDVPQLYFLHNRFSVEDIVSYVTHWFNSENRKLEYLFVSFNNPVSLKNFEIEHLNPMPFCEKRRHKCPVVEEWKEQDLSFGMDNLRKDGLLATFYVDFPSIIFYIWYKRFPDDVQQ